MALFSLALEEIYCMIDQDVIETRAFFIREQEHGIIRVEKKLGVDLLPSDLDDNDRIYQKLFQGEKRLFLIIYEIDCTSDHTFRKRASLSYRSEFKKAEAMVIKSLSNRIEANFYKKNYDIKHPLQVFTDEITAIEWLLSHQ